MSLLDLQLTILVIAVAINFLLLVVVYKQNSRSATNIFFATFCFLASMWLIASYRSVTPNVDISWSRLGIFLASFKMLFFFLFAHTMPERRVRLSTAQLVMLGVVTSIVMLICLSDYAFTGITTVRGVPQLSVGPGMAAFGGLVSFLSVAAVLALWRKLKISTGVVKEQIRFVMAGATLMFAALTGTIMLPIMIFGQSAFLPLIPLYLLTFLGMSAYAIVKYRFLDIRAVLARAVAFVLLLIIVATAYVVVLYGILRQVFGADIDTRSFVAMCAFTVFAIFIFQPVQLRLRKFTNKLFFHTLYDHDQILAEITHVMVEEVEVDPLIRKILTILKEKLHIDHSGMLLLGVENLFQWKPLGFSEACPAEMTKSGIFEVLTDVPCVYEDLPHGELRDFFSQYYIAATFPVKLKGRTIAIFVLGHKLSGETLTESDVLFFELLSSEMAIGIQNAVSFSEIKKFNEELEQRVIERTTDLRRSQFEELEKAKQVAGLKDEFVFLATHELRTPITAIRGFLEMTLDAKDKFPKDIQENLESMAQASNHLNQLVNDLLEIASSEGGKLAIVYERMSFQPLLEEVLRELASLRNEKSITIHDECSDLPDVYGDGTKIKEVLINLIGNAIKYGRQGGNIYVQAYRILGEPTLLVEIRDDGFGIPSEQQKRIFQKFFRAGTPGTEDTLGTGLGLFITRMLVEKMGGKIMFSSSEQHGSTFSFTLPIAQ